MVVIAVIVAVGWLVTLTFLFAMCRAASAADAQSARLFEAFVEGPRGERGAGRPRGLQRLIIWACTAPSRHAS